MEKFIPQTHDIEKATRKIIRGIITTIRCNHRITKAEAEDYLRRAMTGHSDCVKVLLEEVDDYVETDKEQSKEV